MIENHRIADLPAFAGDHLDRMPWVHRVLLENVLRHGAGDTAAASAILSWLARGSSRSEIPFHPGRVLMHDTTCVPALVDIAAMRSTLAEAGRDPAQLNPVLPVDVSVDHSIAVDFYATPDALQRNMQREIERNAERYRLLKWATRALRGVTVHPPGTGIMHTINLERLATVVSIQLRGDVTWAVPDTLIGTDSHTPMINGIGVLAWGVGGLEAESVMFGMPVMLRVPDVVGVRLTGALPEGTLATDLALLVTERLRRLRLSGKFVEFFGPGVSSLSCGERAVVANMAPEYGASTGFFPIDGRTVEYLLATGRSNAHVQFVESYARRQHLWFDPACEPRYTEVVDLDLATVSVSLAGPRRPQDRLSPQETSAALAPSADERRAPDRLPDGADGMGGERAGAGEQSHTCLPLRPDDVGGSCGEGDGAREQPQTCLPQRPDSAGGQLGTGLPPRGAVAIAAITSCTNTSDARLAIAAGLLAKRARALGLRPPAWVKTSFAPGSPTAEKYLRRAGLLDDMEALGFGIVGYGCTTCIGNSGPLPKAMLEAMAKTNLQPVAVLSGNRNFPGRVHPQIDANFLASPPLVVAYALAGNVAANILEDPIGLSSNGRPVYLHDLWPTGAEIDDAVANALDPNDIAESYERAERNELWNALDAPATPLFPWDEHSTYIRRPPFAVAASSSTLGRYVAHPLLVLGDDITTDHISPAGQIPPSSDAATHLIANGENPQDLNVFASRRGNWEVMLRGLYTNRSVRNLLDPALPAGTTRHAGSQAVLPLWQAADRYRSEGAAVIVVAGERYGTGSSRDWAAKGLWLLGVRAVLALSFERIHRSNLIGMGILPLHLPEPCPLASGDTLEIDAQRVTPGAPISVTIRRSGGGVTQFVAQAAVETSLEADLLRTGGILPYILRRTMQ